MCQSMYGSTCVCVFDSQGLYSSERSKGALGKGLDLVVIERKQREILQVLEGIGTNAVNLIGIQQPGRKGKKIKKREGGEGGEEKQRERKERRRGREAACQRFFMYSFIMHSN